MTAILCRKPTSTGTSHDGCLLWSNNRPVCVTGFLEFIHHLSTVKNMTAWWDGMTRRDLLSSSQSLVNCIHINHTNISRILIFWRRAMYLNWCVGFVFVCLSRLPEGGTLVPILITNCILWFVFYCIVLCKFVGWYTENKNCIYPWFSSVSNDAMSLSTLSTCSRATCTCCNCNDSCSTAASNCVFCFCSFTTRSSTVAFCFPSATIALEWLDGELPPSSWLIITMCKCRDIILSDNCGHSFPTSSLDLQNSNMQWTHLLEETPVCVPQKNTVNTFFIYGQ